MSRDGNTGSGPAGQQNGERGKGQVLDVEVLEPENGPRFHNTNTGADHGGAYNGGFYRSGPVGGIWMFPPVSNGGCLSFTISFALFFICLGQYGLLAGIGFLVFHVIGSIIGSLRAARMLVLGLPFNMWAWRVGNWIVSFFLTVWLAGGLTQ